MKHIRNSNIIKWGVISILIFSLIGWDFFSIISDNFDVEGQVQQPSDIVYYLCDAICWTLFSSLLYFITTQYFDNFLWTKRWAFILLGLSIYNLIDECLQDNLMPHYSEWFFAIIWIACTLKYIKNKPSPTNEAF